MSKSQGLSLHLSPADLMRWRSKVVRTATCHIWMGAVGSDGYGRFGIREPVGGKRMLTPHQVAARLAFGPAPVGSTLMHDCDVRVCVATGPGHVRVATQSENMWQAARRGRAAGSRPGLVDVRGNVGASRAIQKVIRTAGDLSPAQLAAILAECVEEGYPWRRTWPLFDAPIAESDGNAWEDFPVDLFDPRAMPALDRVDSLPLF